MPNQSISVIGGIQPDVIRKIAADTYDDGFLQRLLITMVKPSRESKDVPAPDVTQTYSALIYQLTQLRPPLDDVGNFDMALKFDAGAQALRQELERKHLELVALETIKKKLATHIAKYDGYFGRLCVLWHCIEHTNDGEELPRIVTEATARRVADFMQQFLLPHALAFYVGVLGLSDEDDRLRAVAGYILARKLDHITTRHIQRGDQTMRNLNKEDTDKVFDQLEALGWIGRFKGKWIINPTVHTKFTERADKEAKRRNAARELIAKVAAGMKTTKDE